MEAGRIPNHFLIARVKQPLADNPDFNLEFVSIAYVENADLIPVYRWHGQKQYPFAFLMLRDPRVQLVAIGGVVSYELDIHQWTTLETGLYSVDYVTWYELMMNYGISR